MIRTAIVAALAVLSAAIAIAQPATPASAPQALTEADITRDTACGAPGVGWRGVISGGTARIEARREPGQRVNASGWWRPCKAHPVRDCPAMPSPSWIGAAGHYCRATQPTVPARDVGGEVELVTLPGIGKKGAHALQCQRQADGSAAWVVVRTRCGR